MSLSVRRSLFILYVCLSVCVLRLNLVLLIYCIYYIRFISFHFFSLAWLCLCAQCVCAAAVNGKRSPEFIKRNAFENTQPNDSKKVIQNNIEEKKQEKIAGNLQATRDEPVNFILCNKSSRVGEIKTKRKETVFVWVKLFAKYRTPQHCVTTLRQRGRRRRRSRAHLLYFIVMAIASNSTINASAGIYGWSELWVWQQQQQNLMHYSDCLSDFCCI